MKYICFSLLVMTAVMTSCTDKDRLYESLTEEAYSKHKAGDTIFNTSQLLVTCTGNADNYNDMETIVVRKAITDGYNYFQLAPDVYFENSSTLIEYQGFFSSGEDGPFQENGIWVYTDFYKDVFKSGMHFAVDSLPPDYNVSETPVKEGIYFYTNNRLGRISKYQSEEEFKKFGQDGFYFIPNSGRFFIRHNSDKMR